MPRRVLEDDVFAGRLKYYREKAGLTKKRLAGLLGISDQLYNRYENKNAQPGTELIKKIARELKISTDKLLGYNTKTSAFDEAIKILEITKTGYRQKEKTDEFEITLPNKIHVELNKDQLTDYVFFCKEQTDNKLRNPLDSLFKKIFQQAFQEKAKEKKDNRNENQNETDTYNNGQTQTKTHTTFAERLRHFREERNLTQAEIADRAKLKRATYNRYEKKNAQPSILLIKTLATILSISTDELTGAHTPTKKDSAMRYLDKNGIRYKEEKEGIITVYQTRKENQTEAIELTTDELCSVTGQAWQSASSTAKEDMDKIIREEFQTTFLHHLQLLQALKPNLSIDTTKTKKYLYQIEPWTPET